MKAIRDVDFSLANPTTGGQKSLHRSLRRRIYIALGVCAFLAFAVASLIILYNARLERREQLQQLAADARNLTNLLDRETEASRALLIGLSRSPALLADDLPGFYQQIVTTPTPDGSHLILSNREEQLLNSAVPLGTALPKLSVYNPQPLFFERLEADGYYVSGLIKGTVVDVSAMTVSIAIRNDDGSLRYLLTSVLTSERLMDVLGKQQLPEGARLAVLDYEGAPLAGDIENVSGMEQFMSGRATNEPQGDKQPPGKAMITAWQDASGMATTLAQGDSSLSGTSVFIALPTELINRSVSRAWYLLVSGMLAFAMTGGLLYLFLRRKLDAPIDDMEEMLSGANTSIEQLKRDIASVRSREHTRIAQELHDTTAQHLVAADLYLSSIRRNGGKEPVPNATVQELQELIKQALQELRSFSFILRPSDMKPGTFRESLTALFEGYCTRANLACRIEIDPAAECLSDQSRLALFKIAREALSNIHRHAQANTISLSLKVENGSCTMQITDNGRGGIIFPSLDAPSARLGLGLPGMLAKARGLGGDMVIKDSGQGTLLTVRLPVEKLPDAVGTRSSP